jgi:branched-chain amino acid transport system ATP-binding protein
MQFQSKEIRVCYGKAEAIRGINIQVPEGSVVSIIGANGAGKSTFLRAVSGLLPLAGGEIWFQGQRVDGMPPHEIVKSGIVQVPEGRKLFPHLSVLGNLKLGSYLRKDRTGVDEDLNKLFKSFPVLWDRRGQKAGTLSGGEQEILAIARALMAKPRLLLMDEPSLGLAPLVIKDLAKIIKGINSDGVSVLLVEQNAGLVFDVCSRGYVLELGRIVLEGEADELSGNELVQKAFIGGE